MVGNLPRTCNICLKTMRGDHLKRHMLKHKKHENVRMEEKECEKTCIESKYENKYCRK